MAESIVTCSAAQTYALSVTASQTTALAVTASVQEQVNWAEMFNSGSTQVCVIVAPLPASGTAATPTITFPVGGTPSGGSQTYMLPANMTQPRTVRVPTGQSGSQNGFSVSAIASGAGPSIIYITPVIAQ